MSLRVRGLGAAVRTAFGSVTDLGTGLERMVPVDADPGADRVRVSVPDCPPRTLVRIYWLLDDGARHVDAGRVPAAEQQADPRAEPVGGQLGASA